MLRKRIRRSFMRSTRAQCLERTPVLVRLAVIVAAASLTATSGPVFAQASGCTGTISGAIRLVESPGGPLCSAASTGPNDLPGRTIGQILELEGFHLSSPLAGCVFSNAAQPGTPNFPATSGCGVIFPVGSPSSRFEATYSIPAQLSSTDTLDYTVSILMPCGSAYGGVNLPFDPRHVAVSLPCPAIGEPPPIYPNQDVERVPAFVRVLFRLEDGVYGSGDTSVWYGYGDTIPYPSYLTPAQIANTFIIDPDANHYYWNAIVPGGEDVNLTWGGDLPLTFSYTHPTLGPITVPTRDVVGNVAIDFDVDQNGSPDSISPLGIFSVNIPVAGKNESCAVFPIDIVGETEVVTTATISGGQPAGFAGSLAIFGPLDGPTQFVLRDLLPKLYAQLSGGATLERPPTAPGFPFSGTCLVEFPKAQSHEVDAYGYPLTGAAATGFDTRPGYPLPDGPVVPDQCVDFGMERNTGAPFQPFVMTPAKVQGHVLLADAGTPINQVSQLGPTLLEAVAYFYDDPSITHVIPNQGFQTRVATSGFYGGGGAALCEPIPPMDSNPLSPRFGKFFIDRTNNTSLAHFELPALDLNVSPAPPVQNPWLTNYGMVLSFRSGTADSALDEDYVDGIMDHTEREPSSPTGPPRAVTPELLYPGEVLAGQDVDICLGLIRVTLTELAEDPQNPGHTRKFFTPVIRALSQRGYLFSDPDPESPLSPSEIGGPLINGAFYGTPEPLYHQPPASQGQVNLIVPAGRYTLTGTYYLEHGGSTTIPSITGSTGVMVGCGQVVSISNQLSVSAFVPSCSGTGSFTLAGNAFSTPDPPQGASEVAAAQVVTIRYTVNGGAPVILDPNVHRIPPAPEWGLAPAFAVPLSLAGPSCAPYVVTVTAVTQNLNTASSQGLATYDDGTPPTITACPAAPIVLNACTPGGAQLNLETLVTSGQLAASDPNCPGSPFWSFSPNPGSFPVGSTSIQATASDRCGNASVCNFEVVVPSCDDGLYCNGVETCDPAGGCLPGTPPCNDGIACTFDSCIEATDSCDHAPVDSQCDDQEPCTDDSCNPATGCVNTPDDTNACSDDDVCTLLDHCSAGDCVGAPLDCSDNNACTTDDCDPHGGCTNTLISCNDHDKCTNNSCNPQIGCVNTPVSCDDGNACTTDACDHINGCSNTTILCNDNDSCTNNSCNPATGCVFTPQATYPNVINDSLRASRMPTTTMFLWNDPPGAYNVYRGEYSADGPWQYNQSCMEHFVTSGFADDADIPPVGTVFYYLVSRADPCGESPLGTNSSGAERPNSDPCTVLW